MTRTYRACPRKENGRICNFYYWKEPAPRAHHRENERCMVLYTKEKTEYRRAWTRAWRRYNRVALQKGREVEVPTPTRGWDTW